MLLVVGERRGDTLGCTPRGIRPQARCCIHANSLARDNGCLDSGYIPVAGSDCILVVVDKFVAGRSLLVHCCIHHCNPADVLVGLDLADSKFAAAGIVETQLDNPAVAVAAVVVAVVGQAATRAGSADWRHLAGPPVLAMQEAHYYQLHSLPKSQ